MAANKNSDIEHIYDNPESIRGYDSFSNSDENQEKKKSKNGSCTVKYKFWILTCLLVAILAGLAVGITIIVFNAYKKPTETDDNSAIIPSTEQSIDPTVNLPTTQLVTSTTIGITTTVTFNLENFVTREEWLAKPAKDGINLLNLPIKRIIVAHTGDEDNTCLSKDDCINRVKLIQDTNSDLKDIPFNFLIGGDGNVYEGRGFELEGEHTSNVNATSYNDIGICIAFIGTFDAQQPSAIQVEAFHQFINYFVQEEIIINDYKIFSQDQLAPQTIYAYGLQNTIKNWSNFYSVSRIYRRHEWRAFSRCRDSPMLPIPMDRLMLTHTVQRLCTTLADCGQLIQNLQYGMIGQCLPDSYNDIGFGFIIGGDGYVFEGLGFDVQGAHTSGYNSATIGIAFIGDFSEIPPNDAIVEATLRFFDDGMALGKLSDDYRVNARVDFSTAGPGEAFMKIIRTWPRYSKV